VSRMGVIALRRSGPIRRIPRLKGARDIAAMGRREVRELAASGKTWFSAPRRSSGPTDNYSRFFSRRGLPSARHEPHASCSRSCIPVSTDRRRVRLHLSVDASAYDHRLAARSGLRHGRALSHPRRQTRPGKTHLATAIAYRAIQNGFAKHLPDDEIVGVAQQDPGDRRLSGIDAAEFPERTIGDTPTVVDFRRFLPAGARAWPIGF